MTTEPLKLYLPCNMFSVTALVGPSYTLTQLEQLVLRAVAAGADTIGVLEMLFALGSRPTLRLVLGLIGWGYLKINYETSILRVSQEVKEHIAQGKLAELASTDARPESLTLMHDLVAGTVSRIRSRAAQVQTGYILTPRLTRTAFRKVDKGHLLRVADQIVRRWTTRGGQDLKVIELGLDLQHSLSDAGGGEHRLIELEVRVFRDKPSDYVRITILRPDDLGSIAQRRLEDELTHLINLPRPQLALKNLRDQPESATQKDSLDLRARVDQLRSDVVRLGDADPGTEGSWQSKLANQARAIETALALYTVGGLDHQVVSDQARQEEIIESIVRRCRRQLVLSCPFLAYEATRHYRQVVRDALQRGVRIFLLSGVVSAARSEYRLDTGLANWFSDLQTSFPGRFFYSQIEANTHAKFAVGDGSELFVTSYNFLNKTPDRTFELGVWVGTPGTLDTPLRSEEQLKALCFPALHALAIAQEIFPNIRDRQQILTDAVDYGGPEPGATEPSGWPVRDYSETADETTLPQLNRLWERRWQEYARRLTATLAGLGTTFEVVRDARHRELLYEALRNARDRVVVLSDRLSGSVVNRLFMDELKECLGRGVRVVLICQRPEAEALARLRDLERSAEGAELTIHLAAATGGRREGSHAKLLIADDMAVVTSFNFLSFAAEGGEAERYLQSTELGLVLRGREASEAVLRESAERWPQLPLPFAEPVEPGEPELVEPVLTIMAEGVRDVGDLLRELSEAVLRAPGDPAPVEQARVRAEPLRRWFATARSAAAALEEMRDLRLAAPPFVDQVIAAFLFRWREEVPAVEAADWTMALVELLWWEQLDAMGVLVLMDRLAAERRSLAIPPPRIAELTARCDLLDAAPRLFVDAALELEESGEREALRAVAALAIPRVIFVEEGPIDSLDLLAGKLEGGLAAWASAAVAFRGVHPRRQTQGEVAALLNAEAAKARSKELRAALVSELETTLALNLDIKVFQLTWRHLKAGEMGLERLYKAAQKGDLDHVAAFVAWSSGRYGAGGNAAGKMLSAAVQEAAGKIAKQHRRIYGKYRRVCVEHLVKVLNHSRQWVEVASNGKAEAESADFSALRELAVAVRSSREDVERERRAAADSRSYEAPLLERMVHLMKPISELGDKLQ